MTSSKQTERKISSFQVELAILRHIDDARSFIQSSGLPSHLQEFLNIILDLSVSRSESRPESETGPITFTYLELQDYFAENDISGGSRKPLMKKANALCDAGLMHNLSQASELGGRPSRLYVLKPIHKDSVQTVEQLAVEDRLQGHRNTRTKTTRAILKHLEDSDAQLIRYFAQGRPVTETLWTGVLDRALRFSSTEKVPNNRITNKIKIRKTELIVMATTQTGPSSELATLADQRVIRAVVTEVAHYIENFVRDYILDVDQPRQSSLFDDDDDGFELSPPEEPLEIVQGEDGEVDSVSQSCERYARLEQAALERIQNSFFIDVVNLAKRMRFASPHSTSTRRSINIRLRRLYDTNFRLLINTQNEEEAENIMRLFGLEDRVTDFRFLPTLKSQYEKGFYTEGETAVQGAEAIQAVSEKTLKELSETEKNEQAADPYNPAELSRVRVWRLSLDPHLFSRLLDPETRALYTAHKDIMREGSGLAQTLYNLWTQTIGRSNRHLKGQKENIFFMPLTDLHSLLWPMRKYQRFQEEMIELVKRYCRPEDWDHTLTLNTASMFGYKHTLTRKSGVLYLHVQRDRNDELSGDDSYYNRLLKQSAKTTAETT